MTDFRMIYCTVPSIEEARKLADLSVENRLAACANILPGMESVYRWQGKIEKATECVVIFKTHLDRVDALTELIKQKHSYEVPCVVSLPIEQGNQAYLWWIEDETRMS